VVSDQWPESRTQKAEGSAAFAALLDLQITRGPASRWRSRAIGKASLTALGRQSRPPLAAHCFLPT